MRNNMVRKKAAYRKRHQNRFSMFLVTLVVLMILVVVAVQSISINSKLATVDAREAYLNAQIEAENQRAKEIEEYGIYTQTKGYIKEIATDKLGLVDGNEIILKEKD